MNASCIHVHPSIPIVITRKRTRLIPRPSLRGSNLGVADLSAGSVAEAISRARDRLRNLGRKIASAITWVVGLGMTEIPLAFHERD